MKRWMLALVLVLATAACGGADGSGGGQQPAGDEGPTGGGQQPAADEGPTGGDGGSGGSGSAQGDAHGDADVQASVAVRDGQVRGGVRRLQADVGATVALRITSDVADTVHVHGYDLEVPVAPGEPATVEFTADIPGVFEVELEQRGLQVAELAVGA